MRNNLIAGQVNTLLYNMSYNPQGESYGGNKKGRVRFI